MLSVAFLSVVLGVASAAPQVFPQHAPLDQARAEFIREYNRLAALAAAAPDIHIIMSDRRHHLNQVAAAVPEVATNELVGPAPLARAGIENFGFTHTLGQGHQFIPAGHMAGHLAGQQAGAVWTGELAHSVPAGLQGAPAQVRDTPAVAAAKAAHFRALQAAIAA